MAATLAASCASSSEAVESDRSFFGLEEACAPNLDQSILVSAGNLVLDEGEVMEDLNFRVNPSSPNLVVELLLVDRMEIPPGTLALAQDFDSIEGADIPERIVGPTDLSVIVLRRQRIDEDSSVVVERADYVLNGAREFALSDFTWEISAVC